MHQRCRGDRRRAGRADSGLWRLKVVFGYPGGLQQFLERAMFVPAGWSAKEPNFAGLTVCGSDHPMRPRPVLQQQGEGRFGDTAFPR